MGNWTEVGARGRIARRGVHGANGGGGGIFVLRRNCEGTEARWRRGCVQGGEREWVRMSAALSKGGPMRLEGKEVSRGIATVVQSGRRAREERNEVDAGW